MKKYEFILSYNTSEGAWKNKIVVEAYNENDAYYMAFYEFARHITLWGSVPKKCEITYKEIPYREV